MEKFWKNTSDRVHSSVKLQAAGVQFAKNKILNNHFSRILLKLQAFVFYMFITKEQKFSRPSFNGYFRFVVISDLYATVILILGRLHQLSVMYRYCYTKVNSAWTTKPSLLTQDLLHKDLRTKALRKYITLSPCGCKKKHLDQLFK